MAVGSYSLRGVDPPIVHDVSYFDRFAPLYDAFIPATDPEPLSAGLAMADRPLECLLDLGGGTGRAAKALSEPTTVVDGSGPMLRRAREGALPSIRGDVRAIPVKSEGADGIVSVDAIHHFPDLRSVVSEVQRVLRPGGVFVVRDFDPSTLRGRALVLGEHVLGFESTFFTPRELCAVFTEAGLSPTILEAGFAYTVAGVKHA